MSANYRPDLSEFGVVIPPEPLPGSTALRAYLAEQTRDHHEDEILMVTRKLDHPLRDLP